MCVLECICVHVREQFGCSVGLLTCWDSYNFQYLFDIDQLGDAASSSLTVQSGSTHVDVRPALRHEDREPLVLKCKIRRSSSSSIPDDLAFHQSLLEAVRSHQSGSPHSSIEIPNDLRFDRFALDLHFPNVDDEVSERWMRALLWPDDYSISEPRFRQAVSILRAERHRTKWMEGDGLAVLLDLLRGTHEENKAETPSGATRATVFVHSISLYQLSQSMRQQVEESCIEASRTRDIYRISYDFEGVLEGNDLMTQCALHLLEYRQGERVSIRRLAAADVFGNWIEFD